MLTDYKIINGNSLEVLDTLEENSVGSIVTDPPYELNFMGKSWDRSGIAYNVELWKKALRVLKPGGYLLAFGGTRTYHRICCAIEDAGFEIRDCILWLYGSGFPKSLNIGLAIDKKLGIESEVVGSGKSGVSSRAYQSEETTTAGEYEIKKANNEWSGWGTALKPAYEPIIVARKPFKGSLVDNVLEWGVGALNIDECRVGDEEHTININDFTNQHGNQFGNGMAIPKLGEKTVTGRFPANLIHDGSEEAISGMPNTKGNNPKELGDSGFWFDNERCDKQMSRGYDDEGSAARYFYCAKASSKDRDEGLDDFESKPMFVADNEHGNLGAFYIKKAGGEMGDEQLRKNIHPTVKPTELMQYLVRLVTPKGETVLDIFNGSGSTGKAVAFENRERNANYKYIGIELDPEYCKISEARIDYVVNKYKYDILEEIKENEKIGQMSIFDFMGEDDENDNQ